MKQEEEDKEVVGKCTFCNQLIYRNQLFEIIDSPLKDSNGNNLKFLVHNTDCYKEKIKQIFKSVEEEINTHKRYSYIHQ